MSIKYGNKTPPCRLDRPIHGPAKKMQNLHRAAAGKIAKFKILAFDEDGKLIGTAEDYLSQTAA
jgi:hypothetical protein